VRSAICKVEAEEGRIRTYAEEERQVGCVCTQEHKEESDGVWIWVAGAVWR